MKLPKIFGNMTKQTLKTTDKSLAELSNDCQHIWGIDRLAGFIGLGVEGAYIICRNCGKVRLTKVDRD